MAQALLPHAPGSYHYISLSQKITVYLKNLCNIFEMHVCMFFIGDGCNIYAIVCMFVCLSISIDIHLPIMEPHSPECTDHTSSYGRAGDGHLLAQPWAGPANRRL